MDRKEHMQWAKDRALEYVDAGDLTGGFTSLASDLCKHTETQKHPGIQLGMGQLLAGSLSTQQEMRRFIEGFN